MKADEDIIISGLTYLDLVVRSKISGDENYTPPFKNEVFELNPYCWCDRTASGHEESCPPNFSCDDFIVDWYKHVGRDMVYEEISIEKWEMIILKCLKSLEGR